MGWEVEHHSQGSTGGGLGLHGKQGTTVGEGKRRKGGTDIGISFLVYAQALHSGAPVAHATGEGANCCSCGPPPIKVL